MNRYDIDPMLSNVIHRHNNEILQECNLPKKIASPRSMFAINEMLKHRFVGELKVPPGRSSCILVAPGPTMDLVELKRLRPNAIVLAALQCAPAMLAAGVEPDAYVVIDQQEFMLEYAKDLPTSQQVFADCMVDRRFWSRKNVYSFAIPSPGIHTEMLRRAGMWVIPHVVHTVSEAMMAIATRIGFTHITTMGVDYYADMPSELNSISIQVNGIQKWSNLAYLMGLDVMQENYQVQYTKDCTDYSLQNVLYCKPNLTRYRKARSSVMKHLPEITHGVTAYIPPGRFTAALRKELGEKQ